MNNAVNTRLGNNGVYLVKEDQEILLTNIELGNFGYRCYPDISHLNQLSQDFHFIITEPHVDKNSVSVHMIPLDAPRSPLEYTSLAINIERAGNTLHIRINEKVLPDSIILVNYSSHVTKQAVISLKEPLSTLKYLFRRDSGKNANIAKVDLHVISRIYPQDVEIIQLLDFWQSNLNRIKSSQSSELNKDLVFDHQNQARLAGLRVIKSKETNDISVGGKFSLSEAIQAKSNPQEMSNSKQNRSSQLESKESFSNERLSKDQISKQLLASSIMFRSEKKLINN